MKPQITIRQVTLEDIDMMFKWGEENWELWQNPDDKYISKEDFSKWITKPEQDILLIAQVNKKIVGMCLSYFMHTWIMIDALFVEKEYRNQGIAQKFFQETEKIAKLKNIKHLGLLVNEKNINAQEFYLSQGYKTGYKFFWMNKEIK